MLDRRKAFLVIQYNVLIFVVFTMLYYAIGFTGKNYVVNESSNIPAWFGPLYYSIQTHAHLAYGDVTSKSQIIRILSCIHIALSHFTVVVAVL